jgi:hypothetical protein
MMIESIILLDMKKVPTQGNLLVSSQGSAFQPVRSVALQSGRKGAGGIAATEKSPENGVFGEEKAGAGISDLPGNGPIDVGSRALCGEGDDVSFPNGGSRQEKGEQKDNPKPSAVDPALKMFNLPPGLKAVQIDWRYKEGVKKPQYQSVSSIVLNHKPFSRKNPKSPIIYSTLVDEYFEKGKTFSRIPKQKPLPKIKPFTEEEKNIIKAVIDGKEFETLEEMEVAVQLHTQYLCNLVTHQQKEDRRRGYKGWMMFYKDKDGYDVSFDLYERYAKEHPKAFSQYVHVMWRLEYIYDNPKETFCHTLDDNTSVPW